MRCLILGGDGMLGHQLLVSWQERHDVHVTLRRPLADYRHFGLFHEGNATGGIEVRRTDQLLDVMAAFRPEAVLNCVGLIKQRDAAKARIPSLEINALFPHRLRLLCAAAGARLIHLSTDCVFNGRRGMYRETDTPDAEDLYGRTKHLGELHDAPAVTIRSSIIGPELSRHASLVEWFLAQRGTIRGFTNAIYSGLTTLEMADVLEHILTCQPELHGLWQVASEFISKYDLLTRLSQCLGRQDIHIEPDADFHCDRSLDGSRFTQETGYQVPDWIQMLTRLAASITSRKEYHEAA